MKANHTQRRSRNDKPTGPQRTLRGLMSQVWWGGLYPYHPTQSHSESRPVDDTLRTLGRVPGLQGARLHDVNANHTREGMMSRLSGDEIRNGRVFTGYDYNLQVWVTQGIIQDCGHPAHMASRCFDYCNGRTLAGHSIYAIREAEER